jgi:hypothetical protein
MQWQSWWIGKSKHSLEVQSSCTSSWETYKLVWYIEKWSDLIPFVV